MRSLQVFSPAMTFNGFAVDHDGLARDGRAAVGGVPRLPPGDSSHGYGGPRTCPRSWTGTAVRHLPLAHGTATRRPAGGVDRRHRAVRDRRGAWQWPRGTDPDAAGIRRDPRRPDGTNRDFAPPTPGGGRGGPAPTHRAVRCAAWGLVSMHTTALGRATPDATASVPPHRRLRGADTYATRARHTTQHQGVGVRQPPAAIVDIQS